VNTRDQHIVRADSEDSLDLGVARMRLLAHSGVTSEGFSLAEFRGGEGPWTVPHVHNHTEESFFILQGGFTFTVEGNTFEVAPGDYVHVPRGSPHVFGGHVGGGTMLVLWVPGGLEAMFLELAKLPAGSIRDPQIRANISARYDSVPVEPQS